MSRYFTIGMAGHIDHGKTTLTKSLTGIDTDRFKEEKARNISIEPGFAPFINKVDLEVSIIDVPGHENFIRQMIAGVAGIDMVIMVIAADEGMMPQTKEHLDILGLLGIKRGCVVLTKINQVDQELFDIVVEDVSAQLQGTFLEDQPMYFVDSVSGEGITELKTGLEAQISELSSNVSLHPFRLPIDQVFTVKGQGVVVRGTVYDGKISQGAALKVLPSEKDVRARQIEHHHQSVKMAKQGQRTAINLGGITHEEITRGDVLVQDDFYTVTDQVDIAFQPLENMQHKMKQRQRIKLHIGTTEVMGKIIFFDRNEVEQHVTEEILCQLQLDEKIVTTRGDRFVIRRPSPVETIGGGWIIEPSGEKYRFGAKTIADLTAKKEGTIENRVQALLEDAQVLTKEQIIRDAAISEAAWEEVENILLKIEGERYTLPTVFKRAKQKVIHLLEAFHESFPMRKGMDKASLIAEVTQQQVHRKLLEQVLDNLLKDAVLKASKQYIALSNFVPTLPTTWKKRLEQAKTALIAQNLEVEKWDNLMDEQTIPSDVALEFYYFLIQTGNAYKFDDNRLISSATVDQAMLDLRHHTAGDNFTLATAREALHLTRKNLIPLLELFDELGYTRRTNDKREWIESFYKE